MKKALAAKTEAETPSRKGPSILIYIPASNVCLQRHYVKLPRDVSTAVSWGGIHLFWRFARANTGRTDHDLWPRCAPLISSTVITAVEVIECSRPRLLRWNKWVVLSTWKLYLPQCQGWTLWLYCGLASTCNEIFTMVEFYSRNDRIFPFEYFDLTSILMNKNVIQRYWSV